MSEGVSPWLPEVGLQADRQISSASKEQAVEDVLASLATLLRGSVRQPARRDIDIASTLGTSPHFGLDLSPSRSQTPELGFARSTSEFVGLRGGGDEEIEGDPDFWCDLVSGSKAQLPHSQVASMEDDDRSDIRESVLEQLFDLTPERINEVFRDMDRDTNGCISAKSLGEGLRVCGIVGLDASAPGRILKAVRLGSDGTLALPHFTGIIKNLKLAQLLTGRSRSTASARRLTIVDYDAKGAKVDVCSMSRLREFFFGRRATPQLPTLKPIRWVHLSNLDLTLMLSLTVKYSFHPLAVEDVIEQCRTKVEQYGDHYFAAVEQLMLDGDTTEHKPVRVRGNHISIFISGPPNLDTVITVSQPDNSSTDRCSGMTSTYLGKEYKEPGEHWVSRLRQRIEAPLSRLRQKSAPFLLLQVLDVCTDDLVGVTNAFAARLRVLEVELQNAVAELPSSWLDEVTKVRLQLALVLRRARGLSRATRQLDDVDLQKGLSGYLRDIADHLDEVVEDAHILMELSSGINKAYERAMVRNQDNARQVSADKLNNTLFLLTVITVILAPVQLMAGVYGMNFVDTAGVPTIPELLWPNGYSWFWRCSGAYLLGMSIGAVILYKHYISAGPEPVVSLLGVTLNPQSPTSERASLTDAA
mmetsp:Transcript_78559/g.198267  ORF Transcript_78559/g.198267 Transcript_78559/m.198267 type:complete len:643 (+) Transcript_78559:67-1995(+)